MQGQTMQDTAHQHTRPDVAPVCNPYHAAHVGQIVTAAERWMAWSVSETVQIWTAQFCHFVPEK